ncbi:ABC transporter substrate-binding protein [Saccharopolyspora phatthalungensis]|uniref:NitT/TauT family transport system substrate-binding protein n=1 Tax=Saccharopolyspora phatthalungensis TaxID=664693 RepID=A0A840Q573_9PSEU|nr:ABC transporter substrate-binding protein [Saccharopolyspora phatthalungensis]MBB5153839.1 NitT/TauT family transport system substrate-binding protein [Saccharopolyspora phatthalungensis]
MSPLPRRDLLKLAGGMITAGAVMGTGGCGLLGGSEAQQGGNAQVEKANLRVGGLPTSELAPLHLAVQNGHFQREGLTVEIINAADGASALNSTIGGDYDITFSSYVPIFAAQAHGVAQLKIVADCASSVPNTCMIMASPNSSVRRPKDLAGKKIAISGAGTISELMVKAAMKANGVDYGKVQWVPLGFVNMPNALRASQVDAAFVVEPFLTLSARDAGAIPVVDTATGPLEDLPLGGYVSSAKFADENPKTISAFQRAMDTAVAEAQDRSKIEPLLPQFAKIDKETASIITLLKMNSRADSTRLQRIPRLMREFGYIDKDVDVASMIIAPPQS